MGPKSNTNTQDAIKQIYYVFSWISFLREYGSDLVCYLGDFIGWVLDSLIVSLVFFTLFLSVCMVLGSSIVSPHGGSILMTMGTSVGYPFSN